MILIIKGHNRLKISPTLKKYIEKKIRKFERLVKEPATCEVVLEDLRGEKDGLDKVVKITLELPGLKKPLFVSKRSSDFIGSIDWAEEKLKQKITKYKDEVKIGRRHPLKYTLSKLFRRRSQ